MALPMIILMRPDATEEEVSAVLDAVMAGATGVNVTSHEGRTVITGAGRPGDWVSMPGVERVVEVEGPLRLVGRGYREAGTVVEVAGVAIGGGEFVVVAGPCAVESRDQLLQTARAVAAAGGRILRGDAFKPRTSPYAFQGLGEDALKILADAREETGLPFVAEVIDPRDVEMVASYADMLRVGTRNMSNYPLLREVGRADRPVQLKRGRTATIDEWLSSAEYVMGEGNPAVVLVERGIRTFEPSVRNTLDISAIPILRGRTHLPVMVDPSHASGRRDLVGPLTLAAMAAGADGVMIDVHPDPDQALVDGAQALSPDQFERLMGQVRSLGTALAGAGSEQG